MHGSIFNPQLEKINEQKLSSQFFQSIFIKIEIQMSWWLIYSKESTWSVGISVEGVIKVDICHQPLLVQFNSI